MARLTLYPPYGTIRDAESLKFSIDNIVGENFRVHLEDATHGKNIKLLSFEKKSKEQYVGVMQIDFPPHSSQSIISIFAHIEEIDELGNYKTVQICPAIFEISEKLSSYADVISLSPTFISTDDICSIQVSGPINSKLSISINDKIFRIITNEDGIGSIHFKGYEIINDDSISSLQRIPVYCYEPNSNYTKKIFTGHYLNVLPHSLAMHASLDPRCDPTDPLYQDPNEEWVMPEECLTQPVEPNAEDPNPFIEPTELPSSGKEEGDSFSIHEDVCRIYGHSVALMNNGMVIHAYISPDQENRDIQDNEYNVNRVFIKANDSALDVQIINVQDIIIESKDSLSDYVFHVTENLWNALEKVDDPSSSDIYVVLFTESISFRRIKIISRSIDEYTGDYIVIGEDDEGVTISEWLFCVNAVFYHSTESPSTYITDQKIPYVSDSNGNLLQIINVSVASNVSYVGTYEESYIYIVVEALKNSRSQLFLYCFSLGRNNEFSESNTGWNQITYSGNNRHPNIKCGEDNNLQVVWESDRGGITQIYYGILGLSFLAMAGSFLSSFIDKYSQFISSNEEYFDSLQTVLFQESIGDGSNPIPEYGTEDIVKEKWKTDVFGDAEIIESSSNNYLNDISISAHAVQESAMAFASVQIVQDSDSSKTVDDFPYSQFNYQISFKLRAIPTQMSDLIRDSEYDNRSLDQKEIDRIFEEWKSGYNVEIDADYKNQPIYVKDNNRFIIGRKDFVFDRIIPIVGSYHYDVQNPSLSGFQINISKANNNLKDFTLGLMFEKTYFQATNIETLTDYLSHDYSSMYIPTIKETIYTGRAKLVALIRNQEGSDIESDYIIIREFPEVLEFTDLKQYDIILNYKSIESREVNNILYTQNRVYTNSFLGCITLLIDTIPRFSQSFISSLDLSYNYFDIGFGIPYGGFYISDKMLPSKMGIYDDTKVSLTISDINITSPTYSYNSNILSVPPQLRQNTKLFVYKVDFVDNPSCTILYSGNELSRNEFLSLNYSGKEEILYCLSETGEYGVSFWHTMDITEIDEISVKFFTKYEEDRLIIVSNYGDEILNTGYISTGLDVSYDVSLNVSDISEITIQIDPGSETSYWKLLIDFKKIYNENGFLQVPITIEGINQSPSTDIGICNDLHIVWESNRDRYWNIYYTNSCNKLSPFRYDTQITNTESNSIKPSVAVNRDGYRMIVWHDNREGNYNIYAARSLTGYTCNEDRCETKMIKSNLDEITECTISIEFSVPSSGIYNFSLNFYNDPGLQDLYKTISMTDSNDKWFVNGSSIDSLALRDNSGNFVGIPLNQGESIMISYIPSKSDRIFDMVLYVKLATTID